MYKKFATFVLVFLFLFAYHSSVSASSLVKVSKDGDIVWNVLAMEDSLALGVPQRDSLEVKKLAVSGGDNRESQISFTKENGKAQLSVISADKEELLDISSIKGEIVEIEERPSINKLQLGLVDAGFTIKQEGITAITPYEIKVKPSSAELSLSTPSGNRFLSVLPKEAVDNLLKLKIISSLMVGNTINLLEEDKGVLTYVINGEKEVNVFNLFNYPVPISARVSAVNGEILKIDQPAWYRVLGFLFS